MRGKGRPAFRGGIPIRRREDFLVFGSPLIEEEEISEVVATLRSGWIGTGPRVSRLEEEVRRYKGARYAVAVNSGTAALHLACLSAGIGPGDEVITTAMTFCATVNAIIHSGAKPVLVDCDPNTLNIDVDQIAGKITPKTKAILPVHFAGRPCEMDALEEIAKRHRLTIIEDCAHAVEGEYHGKGTGTFGKFGCFSFYVTKNVMTGEGGMVITDSEDSANRIKVLALHGMSKDAWKRFNDEGYRHYEVTECGFKYNMTDLQAALGIHQFKRVDKCWQRRQEIWRYYTSAFSGLPIDLPGEPSPDTRHAYHLYTILIDEKRNGLRRDEFLSAMTAENVGVGVHYLSISEHPYYQRTFGWKPEDYPNATRIGRQTASLPLSPKLGDKDVEDVTAAVERIVRGWR